ncbi:hypothetical protein V6N13_083684 [Hibiscus sabdariffa]
MHASSSPSTSSGEFTVGCLCSNSARSDIIKGSNRVKVVFFGSGEYLDQNQSCGFKSNSSELDVTFILSNGGKAMQDSAPTTNQMA